MALFSSSSAIQNLNKVGKRAAPPPQKNCEYKDFATYRAAGGIYVTPEEWVGQDGKWLKQDRDKGHQRWKNAMMAIIKNYLTMKGHLMPFEQVSDFYVFTQILVSYRKHNTLWLYGANYLVGDLADAFQRTNTATFLQNSAKVLTDPASPFYADLVLFNTAFPIFVNLLKQLNLNIADYALSQFYRLLYGDKRNARLTGLAAWKFDKQFIFKEQAVVAFPVYSNPDLHLGIILENWFFNKVGGFRLYDWTGAYGYIPVFPDQYDSNLSVNQANSRFGEEARVLVPLGMLYPNEFFYNDTTAGDDTSITGNDPNIGNIAYAVGSKKFAHTLENGYKKKLSAGVFGGRDEDIVIYNAYSYANNRIKERMLNSLKFLNARQ